jgi:hypothetical protein
MKQTLERILEVKKKKSLATRNTNTRKRQDRTAVTDILPRRLNVSFS